MRRRGAVGDAAAAEIGARAERLVARAGEHDDAHVVVGARARDRVAQTLHDSERHRVATLGTIDRHARHARGVLVEHLVRHQFGIVFAYDSSRAGVRDRHRRGAR